MFVDNKKANYDRGGNMLSLNEKKEILKIIFQKTDKMNDTEKSYLLGYIKGFEDKANLSILKDNKVYEV